jgi:hypothetical protein
MKSIRKPKHDFKGSYVLTGTLQTFNGASNGRIYNEEYTRQAIRDYVQNHQINFNYYPRNNVSAVCCIG